MSNIDKIQAKRAARKAALASKGEEQKATDLEAIDALEIEFGDANVSILEIPYVAGAPVLAAVRTPSTAEVKRYRFRLKGKDPDTAAAAEEVGASCVIYPKGELLDKMLAARPGLSVQLGTAALELATAKQREEEKS